MDPDAELPHGWTSRRDSSSGRTFYVDHATRETTWQRPVAPAEENDKDKAGPSPPTSMSGRFTLERIKSVSRLDPTTCSPRRQAFWASAVFGWVVWVMAVAVTLGDGWIQHTGLVRVGRHEDIDFLCDFYLTYSWCSTFDAFTAVQIVGVIVCSTAVIVISISWCLSQTRGMAYAGGTLFVLYAAFQCAAIVLAVRLRSTFTDAYFARPGVVLPGYGVTFKLGVAAACISFVEGIILLSLAGQAGPGPIHVCRTSPDACGGRVTHQAPGARQIAYPMRAIVATPAV